MRKATFLSSLGLALTLGAGALAAQQAPSQQAPGGQRSGEMRRGRGGPEAFLLRGITLSADQQQKVQDLRKEWRANRPAGAEHREAQGQRQAPTEAQRQEMQKQREQHFAALRAILTPDQQKQFDANVAQMKQRAEARRNGAQRPGAER